MGATAEKKRVYERGAESLVGEAELKKKNPARALDALAEAALSDTSRSPRRAKAVLSLVFDRFIALLLCARHIVDQGRIEALATSMVRVAQRRFGHIVTEQKIEREITAAVLFVAMLASGDTRDAIRRKRREKTAPTTGREKEIRQRNGGRSKSVRRRKSDQAG